MDTKKNSNIVVGARILILSFVLLFFVFFARFGYIQITQSAEGKMLTEMAEKKWTKERVLHAERGKIMDRNGEVLVKDAPSYTVYAILDESYTQHKKNPLHVTDPQEAAEKLAPILNMDVNDLERRMSLPDRFQVELGPGGNNISLQMKEEIEKLKIPGIGFISDRKRYYPNGVFASHLIGYVRKGEDEGFVGQMGIEMVADTAMHGKDGKISYQSDRKGFMLPNPNEIIESPKNGDNVYLTIDQKIQTFLESALTTVEEQYKPEKVIAIVVNPKTGEVLAMGNRPSFDPNILNIKNYLNDAVSDRFEPGSTMKVFTLAAAVNEGVFNGNDIYQSGSYSVSSKLNPIRDHNKVGWGKISFLEGVQRSSNVGFAILANEELGTDKLLNYLQRFRFDQKTGIELPNETVGSILYRYPIEKITTAFGQGTTVTPIGQVQAATSIANDGKMMKPFVIRKIVDSKTGEVIEKTEPKIVDEPITKETAQKVRGILETVVSAEAGTGKPYRISGYSVAGKTGTAQIPDPETGKYMTGHGNYIFSFLGMAPADDPKLLVYVAVKKPELKPVELGSEPVSYIFNTVMKNSLHYLDVMPQQHEIVEVTTKEKRITLPSFVGQMPSVVKEKLEKEGVSVIYLGNGGKITKQLPISGTNILEGDKLFIRSDGEIKMPNIEGWSLRDVMKLTDILGLKPTFIGNGFVTAQNIKPGALVKKGDFLVVELKDPEDKTEKLEEQSGSEERQTTITE